MPARAASHADSILLTMSRDRMGTAYSVRSRLNLHVVGDWIGTYRTQSCPERSSGDLGVPRDFRYAGLAHATGTVSPIRAAIRLLSARPPTRRATSICSSKR